MFDRRLLEIESAGLADGELEEHVLALIALRDRVEAATLAAIGEWDARYRWRVDGAVSPGQWLASHCGLSGPDARGLATNARRIRHTTLVAAGLAAGDLTVGKAKALASARIHRVAATFDEHEAGLIAAAEPLSADDTALLARQWLQQADQDGPEPDPDEQEARLSVTFGGRGVLDAFLAPEGTLVLQSVLNQIMADLYKADVEAGLTPHSAARRRADALIEMARRASAAEDSKPHARPLIVIRCDLSDLFTRAGWEAGAPAFRPRPNPTASTPPGDEAGAASPTGTRGHGGDRAGNDRGGGGSGGGCGWGGGGCSGGASAGGFGGGDFDGGAAETDDGHPISPGLFRQLLCDADVMRVIVDGPSKVLDVGRAERTATTIQRRALLIRDGGCVFPGCNRPPAWCEAHHIWWWEQGGPTNIDNLALLCSHHHHLIHKGEFQFQRDGDQFVFTRADGTTIIVPVGQSRARHRSAAYASLRS